MTDALYDSDLAFNTYFDVLLYWVAGLIILHGHYAWLISITANSCIE